MGPIFPQVAMFVLPLLSLLPLALSDNLWGGVQTGEAVEPSFQQAETVYSPDPAALKVEEQQYQEGKQGRSDIERPGCQNGEGEQLIEICK